MEKKREDCFDLAIKQLSKSPLSTDDLVASSCSMSFAMQNLGFNFDNECVKTFTMICSDADDIQKMIDSNYWREGEFFTLYINQYEEAANEARDLLKLR